jgi:hypothetical protein
MNPELFYTQQLNNDNATWRLYTSTQSGDTDKLVLKGVMDPEELLEFEFRIQHSYSDKDSNGLSDIIDGPLNTIADFAKNNMVLANSLGAVGDAANQMAGMFGSSGSKVGEKVGSGISWINKQMASLSDGLSTSSLSRIGNSRFISAASLVQTFTGTDISYALPDDLSTVILHDDEDPPVKDQIKTLLGYTLGETQDFGGVYGLQMAPNEYTPDLQQLNRSSGSSAMKGTMILQIGKLYTIKNLILKSVNFKLSRHQVKGKDRAPLYAMVSISLDPATYITKSDIISTILN